MDILTYTLAKKYTDKALLGVGTIKGAPCTVKSQTEDDEYVYVTLGWENNLGISEETVVKIKKGADGAPGEPGPAGDPGPQGISITKIEKIKTEGLIDTYQISFSDDTTFEYTVSNGSDDYLNMNNKPSIEGVELIGNKTFEDLNIASAGDLSATDGHLQDLSDLIGDKTNLPIPTDTVVDNIALVDSKVDAIIDDNEIGLAKTFSSDRITKTFATLEEVNERIPQYDTLPTPTEACGGQVVQFIGTTTEDYIHNYFYECVQVEDSYKWVNVAVQNIPTKVSELTNDNNFVTETELNEKGYLTEHQDISGKVDKEEGKSLIADSEITRLSTVKNYDDSAVKEDIATIKTDYATKTYIGEQITAADHLKREIVTEVPTAETAAENVIYMLKVESTVGADKYKEYMLIDGEVACVGDTSVDLTDYAKKNEIPTELPANGGNADTVNTHTVASDVPEDAIFTDTVYDDTEVQKRISDNGCSEIAGGKNLLNKNKFVSNITVSTDGSLVKDDSYNLIYVPIKANVDYVFSRTLDSSGSNGVVWGISDLLPNVGGTASYNPVYPATANFNVKSNTDGYFLIRDRFDKHEEGTGTNWQLEEGSEATEYEPYFPSNKMLAEETSSNSEDVNTLKKETTVNLLNPTLQTETSNGITCTNNGDGTYTLNGTATNTVRLLLGKVPVKANKSYKLIAQSPADTSTNVKVYDKNGIIFGDGTYKGATPIGTLSKDFSITMFIEIANTTALDNFIVKPMITTNLDAAYDDFVPYTGDTGKLNSDVADIRKNITVIKEDIIDPTIYQGIDLTIKFANEIKNYSDEWAWIKARITAGDYAGLHVSDYIPITCSNDYKLNAQIAGMNTYTGYSDQEVGNHIDFICKELWDDSHVMNKIDYNNGNANSPNPFLASDLNYWLNSMSGTVPNSETDTVTTVEVDYTADGILYYLPDKLKNQIITKRVLLPSRYKADSVLIQDNSWSWKSTGKLWIPSEIEVYGITCWGNNGHGAGGFVQYPIFIGNMNRLKKRCFNKDRCLWWLLSASAGDSTNFADVSVYGHCNFDSATYAGVAAPVCFRI